VERGDFPEAEKLTNAEFGIEPRGKKKIYLGENRRRGCSQKMSLKGGVCHFGNGATKKKWARVTPKYAEDPEYCGWSGKRHNARGKS